MTAEEYIADVRLIFTNCYAYNGPGNQVREMGKQLQQIFEAFIKELPKEPDVVEPVRVYV